MACVTTPVWTRNSRALANGNLSTGPVATVLVLSAVRGPIARVLPLRTPSSDFTETSTRPSSTRSPKPKAAKPAAVRVLSVTPPRKMP